MTEAILSGWVTTGPKTKEFERQFAAAVGAKHGIACPTVRKLVDLIHEVEDGRRALSDDNLLELIPGRVN